MVAKKSVTLPIYMVLFKIKCIFLCLRNFYIINWVVFHITRLESNKYDWSWSPHSADYPKRRTCPSKLYASHMCSCLKLKAKMWDVLLPSQFLKRRCSNERKKFCLLIIEPFNKVKYFITGIDFFFFFNREID